MKLLWSPLAMDRVAEIAAYIAQHNPPASEKWVRALFARAERLRAFPASGRPLAETPRTDVREIVWGNYRIVYRLERRCVAILTVRHVKQILPLDELLERE